MAQRGGREWRKGGHPPGAQRASHLERVVPSTDSGAHAEGLANAEPEGVLVGVVGVAVVGQRHRGLCGRESGVVLPVQRGGRLPREKLQRVRRGGDVHGGGLADGLAHVLHLHGAQLLGPAAEVGSDVPHDTAPLHARERGPARRARRRAWVGGAGLGPAPVPATHHSRCACAELSTAWSTVLRLA